MVSSTLLFFPLSCKLLVVVFLRELFTCSVREQDNNHKWAVGVWNKHVGGLAWTLMKTLNVRSLPFIPQSHAPLSFTPACSLKVPFFTVKDWERISSWWWIQLICFTLHKEASLALLSACFWSESSQKRALWYWTALLVTLSPASIDSFPTHLT